MAHSGTYARKWFWVPYNWKDIILAYLWQYAITSLHAHSYVLLRITAALRCQACTVYGHVAQDRQQSGFFGGVLRQKHRHHHIFGNMQIHNCMRMCMGACSCGSQPPYAIKLAQCNALQRDLCSRVDFEGVLRTNHTHHHIFGNMQISVCMCIAVCSWWSQLPDTTKFARYNGL